MKISKKEVTKLALSLLKEDKSSLDITSKDFLNGKQMARATIISNEKIVLSGIDFALQIFKLNCKSLNILTKLKDGSDIKKGKKILVIEGNGRKILSAERAALNLLQHLSGISTLTAKFCNKAKKNKVQILDTRKTTPGLRKFDKYAAFIGGAKNHRLNLFDGYMLKDNHMALNDKIYQQILKINDSKRNKIILECDNLVQVKKALNLKIKYILLDNMNIKTIKKAKSIIGNKAKIEISGGININNIIKLSKTGINYISVGAITHSAPAANISLTVERI